MAHEPLRTQFDSYEPRALKPAVGSTWIWERDKPHAREQVRVVAVEWNDEEWWVKTASPNGAEYLNDLSRFWEAVWPDPDPNEAAVGETIIWSGRPSYARDLPSGWVNRKARTMRWTLIGDNVWQHME